MIYRKLLEVIKPLLKSLVYVRSDQEITSKLKKTTNSISTKRWNKQVKFQGGYQDSFNILQSEKREILKKVGADRNMQPIPHTGSRRGPEVSTRHDLLNLLTIMPASGTTRGTKRSLQNLSYILDQLQATYSSHDNLPLDTGHSIPQV